MFLFVYISIFIVLNCLDPYTRYFMQPILCIGYAECGVGRIRHSTQPYMFNLRMACAVARYQINKSGSVQHNSQFIIYLLKQIYMQ